MIMQAITPTEMTTITFLDLDSVIKLAHKSKNRVVNKPVIKAEIGIK